MNINININYNDGIVDFCYMVDGVIVDVSTNHPGIYEALCKLEWATENITDILNSLEKKRNLNDSKHCFK